MSSKNELFFGSTELKPHQNQRTEIEHLKRKTMKTRIFLILPVVLLCGGCIKQTDESIIRSRLAQINRLYESRNFDELRSFYFSRYLEQGGSGRKPGWFENWKTHQQKLFSAYPTIHLRSTILSVDRVNTGYIVQETISIDGVDSAGHTEPIRENERQRLGFVKEGDSWVIAEQMLTRVFPFYDSLSEKYAGIGQLGLAYVCQTSLDFVSVIDPAVRKVIGIIPCGLGPTSLAFAEENNLGYITNFRSGTVTVFNKKTNERITDIPVGVKPAHVVVDPTENFIYVAHQSADGIWIISGITNEVFWKIRNDGGPMRWNGKQKKLYISHWMEPVVESIDPANNYQTEKIQVGGRPLELAFSADQKFLYVANYGLNEVEKIDLASRNIVKHIGPIYDPRGICIDPEGAFAYVTNVQSNKLTVIDLRKETVVDSVDIGRMPTTVSYGSATHTLFVSNQGEYRITEFDPVSRTIRDTITVADNPIDVMVDNGKIGANF